MMSMDATPSMPLLVALFFMEGSVNGKIEILKQGDDTIGSDI